MIKNIEIFKKFELAILTLDKNCLLYSDKFNSLKLELTEDIIIDLEVINKAKLIETVSLFITNNKLPPKNLLMVLSAPLFFEKTFRDHVDIEAQSKIFLENVPFENISSKLIANGQESTLLVVNRDIFMFIKEAFENEGFSVNSVLPYLALEKHKLNIKKKIDDKTTKEFNQKLKLLEQDNFLTETKMPKPKKENRLSFIKMFLIKIIKMKKNRFFVLLSVFVVLIFFLVALLIFQKSQSNSRSITQVPEQTLVSPTPSQNNINASDKTLESTTIKISSGTQRLKVANTFRDRLNQLGFKNVTVVNENSQNNTSKTFVVFSPKFPEILKQKVITSVNKTFIDPVIQESNDVETDVLITAGQAY